MQYPVVVVILHIGSASHDGDEEGRGVHVADRYPVFGPFCLEGDVAVPVYFGEIAFAFQKVVQLGTQGLLFCIQRILRCGPGQRQGGHCKE